MRSIIFLIIISSTFLGACKQSGDTPVKAAPRLPVVLVRTISVGNQHLTDLYEATGTVRARSSTTLSSKVMAYVRQISVRAGDRVREGQELITLDSQEMDANLRRAEAAEAEVRSAFAEADNAISISSANLELTQITFKRMEELASRNSISRQEFDETATRLKTAQSGYEMARARRAQLDSRLKSAHEDIGAARIMKGYTRLVAPFSGLITSKSAEAGTLAVPGAPLLTIERDDSFEFEASVGESSIAPVKIGQSVEVLLEALNRRLSVRVSEIVPAVDSASRAYIIKLALPSVANLRSGMFGRAWFPAGTRSALSIPAQALTEREQLQSVFVVEDGIARNRLVTTGKRLANAVEVLSGLHLGEVIVAEPAAGLADGISVEVQR